MTSALSEQARQCDGLMLATETLDHFVKPLVLSGRQGSLDRQCTLECRIEHAEVQLVVVCLWC